MKTLQLIIMLISISVMVASCSAEDGIDGANGINGTNGLDGTNGEQGSSGTANVLYSNWETINFTDAGGSWIANWPVANITQDILDHGMVMVYFKNCPNCIFPLPLSINSGFYVSLRNLALDEIILESSSNLSTQEFRYVIIPGGILIDNTSASKFNNISYHELSFRYNILD